VENAKGKKKEKKGKRRDDYGHKEKFGDTRKGGREEKKGIMVRRIKYDKGILRIVEVYVNRDMEKKLEELKEWMVERKKRIGIWRRN